MKIVFSMEFDVGFWPGPGRRGQAVFGELWAGPTLFLSCLETWLGLAGPVYPQAVRAAALVPEISRTQGFWSQSAKVDPFGTARQLIKWRDELWLHGWRGGSVSPRFDRLAAVTARILPGFPDRLQAVDAALDRRPLDIERIEIMEPLEWAPHGLRQIFLKLQASGVQLSETSLKSVTARGDLAACRNGDFQPSGDGSLVFLRPTGPNEAAHEVAAWLAGRENPEDTVIIGSDPVLDMALHRFGLPVTGAKGSHHENALLQILPLAMALGWDPPDPNRVLEFLLLPTSPVPQWMSRRLVRALQEHPAVDSDAWRTAVKDGLAIIDDSGAREKLSRRMDALFNIRSGKGGYSAQEIVRRINLLRQWGKGRQSVETDESNYWNAYFSQLGSLEILIDLSGLNHFSEAQLQRLIHDATREVNLTPVREAQAGILEVGGPGCIVGPVKRVIWWSFNQEAAFPAFSIPLTQKELSALNDHGVYLPEPSRLAWNLAQTWRRPLLLTEECLVLVCPRRAANGEDLFPHPIWSEIAAGCDSGDYLASIERTDLTTMVAFERKSRPLKPLPEPCPIYTVTPEPLKARNKESVKSLDMLMRCPAAWVIQYIGRIWGGFSSALSTGKALEGLLIHEIIAGIMAQGPRSPREAVVMAERLFNEEGPRIAAQIFQPGFEEARAGSRKAVMFSCERLMNLIETAGCGIQGVEKTYDSHCPELEIGLAGRPDLVLESPGAVIDFKRTTGRYRRNELVNGTATQLAIYSRIVGAAEKKRFPPTAYFGLLDSSIISTQSDYFPGSTEIQGPIPEEIWSSIVDAVNKVRRDLMEGIVRASGIPNSFDNSEQAEADLNVFEPSCSFCGLNVLCGRHFGEANE